jgi:hypothetical protein
VPPFSWSCAGSQKLRGEDAGQLSGATSHVVPDYAF